MCKCHSGIKTDSDWLLKNTAFSPLFHYFLCFFFNQEQLNFYSFLIFSQIWYYTSGILRAAGFAEDILPYFTLSTGAVETLAAIVSVRQRYKIMI